MRLWAAFSLFLLEQQDIAKKIFFDHLRHDKEQIQADTIIVLHSLRRKAIFALPILMEIAKDKKSSVRRIALFMIRKLK